MSLRTLALGALSALGATLSLQAQCYEPATGSPIGTGDDAVLPMQALGFVFPFGGGTWTDVHVETNGRVFLSNGGVPAPGGADWTPLPAELVAGSPKIAAYWSDLNVVSGTGTVLYNALPGKAVITWQNAVEYGNTEQFTVQLQLLASGEILIAYDGRCQVRTAGDFIVGASEGGNATIPPVVDLAAAGVSATSTTYEVFDDVGRAFDLTGKTLHLVPAGAGWAWVASDCAAAHSSYGAGCYVLSDSIYQRFADAGAAAAGLSGQSVTFQPIGNVYLVSWGGAAYVAPGAGAVNLTATPSDDLEVLVTPTLPLPTPDGPQATLRVHTNGFVTWGATAQTFPGTTNYAPTAAGFLTAANAGIYAWHDYNEFEAGSGRIKREELGSTLYVTWDGVENYSTPAAANPTTMQMQFDLTTGAVSIVWAAVDANPTSAYGSAHLVGWTAAGASADGGSVALATALPVVTSPINASPLVLTGTPAPVSTASAGTTITYTTSDIPEFVASSGLFVAVNILSLTPVPAPGLDLGFLGAPGCTALVGTPDATQAMVGVAPSQSVSFVLPAGVPSGVVLWSQSAALVQPGTLNPFGLTTSNGLRIHVGEF